MALRLWLGLRWVRRGEELGWVLPIQLHGQSWLCLGSASLHAGAVGTNVSIHVGDVLPCAAVLLWLMRCPTPALQKYNRHSRKAEPPGRAGREANGMKPVQNGKAAGSTK